jgi:hypothetical protein
MSIIPMLVATLIFGVYLYYSNKRFRERYDIPKFPPSISFTGEKTKKVWISHETAYFVGTMMAISVGVLISMSMLPDPVNNVQKAGNVIITAGAFLIFTVGVFVHYTGSKFELWGHMISSYGGIGLPIIIGAPLRFGAIALPFTAVFILVLLATNDLPSKTYWREIVGFVLGYSQIMLGIIL